MHTYIHIHTCMHTYIHTYTHTYIHTYIHTYTHTYKHTYIHTYIQVALGVLVVIVLAIQPKVCLFKQGRGQWVIKEINFHSTTSYGREVKSSVRYRKALRHVNYPYSVKEILCRQNSRPLLSKFPLLRYQVFLLVTSGYFRSGGWIRNDKNSDVGEQHISNGRSVRDALYVTTP
jgi:hypothetical protein